MSYIKENLMPNEKIIYTAQVSPLVFLPAVIAFMSTIFFIILGVTANDTAIQISLVILAVMFFFLVIRMTIEATTMILTTELAITNRRIIAKTGFIHRNALEMFLPKIESVNVYQNILGRWLNFGNVTITGTGGTKGTFKAIINPEKVRAKINQIIEHYAQAENQPTQR